MYIPINMNQESQEKDTLLLLAFVDEELAKMLSGELSEKDFTRMGYVLVALLKILIACNDLTPPEYIEILMLLGFDF